MAAVALAPAAIAAVGKVAETKTGEIIATEAGKTTAIMTKAATGIVIDTAESVLKGTAGEGVEKNLKAVNRAQLNVADTAVSTVGKLAALPVMVATNLAEAGHKFWDAAWGTQKPTSDKSYAGGSDSMNIKIALMILFIIFLIVLIVYQIGASDVAYTCVIATGIAYTIVFIIDKICEKKV